MSLADTVELPRDGQDGMLAVQVTVKQVAVIDMSEVTRFLTKRMDLPQAALQVLDIVLRNPSAMRPVCVPVGKSFFTPPPRPDMTTPLGNGYELWYGFFQSAVLGWQPYLNVDAFILHSLSLHAGTPSATKKPPTVTPAEFAAERPNYFSCIFVIQSSVVPNLAVPERQRCKYNRCATAQIPSAPLAQVGHVSSAWRSDGSAPKLLTSKQNLQPNLPSFESIQGKATFFLSHISSVQISGHCVLWLHTSTHNNIKTGNANNKSRPVCVSIHFLQLVGDGRAGWCGTPVMGGGEGDDSSPAYHFLQAGGAPVHSSGLRCCAGALLRPHYTTVAHKGFPEAKPLTEVILEIKGRRIRGDIKPTSELLKQGLTGYEAEDFEKSIKGLRIRYEIPTVSGHRYFKVNGIKKDSCRKHR
ncbi:Protein argonaute-2 [Homalodisca vitripennis]|nr:Protein argonaute-2 [Homalodisca vitripennis]